ncbi:TPA: phasin family protein [Stenotrophomonas maltophilia]|uniref:phasin family protein n=1 Tax=Stenotrophomonas TaxID=40323 RepID=UPI0028AD378C|nr:phasin family protein [Stenotrophomonas sp.]HDS0948403.1 phasin family protein [Stenotrophomonas maltophilia]HDS1024744.1 phasin family protein [Stenotrophomonas maltophilia]HDS1030816.1 phasin family protein [Stenotrophomonas maltophilia]HDS1033477.1 phasin family protein [Stenotrophomonas maltophilia]HDS1039763.1 phasin family protein [Stenotrophomonas maltophilia]
MAAAFADRFSDATRQLAAAATRANRLALENAESMFGVQLKAMERNLTATGGWLGELARSEDPAGLLPKGAQLWQDNLQRLGQAQQDVVDLGLQAGRAWSDLVQGHNQTPADATGNSH